MLGAAGTAFPPAGQQPRQADAYRAAHPAPGEALAPQVGKRRTALGSKAAVGSASAHVALAICAQMMLFAMAGRAIFLVPG